MNTVTRYSGSGDRDEANKAEEGILNPVMVFIGIGMFFGVVGLARLAGIDL